MVTRVEGADEAARQQNAHLAPVLAEGYQLIKRLAFGGMAEIFLAEKIASHGFRRKVVVKQVLPQYANDEVFLSMFFDEARLAARLSHPNLVQVSDFGTLAGRPFLVMEYIDGADLRQVTTAMRDAETSFSLGSVLRLGLSIASALEYVEQVTDEFGERLNIVHRDISPHNIMLGRSGDVKLMDFGIAKAANRLTHTQTGVLKGKLHYMSPEQARHLALDHRSDQFALGLILWELLAKRRAYEGRSETELLELAQEGRVDNLTKAVDDVPASVAESLMRMLCPDPDSRFETPTLVRECLEREIHQLGDYPGSLRREIVWPVPRAESTLVLTQSETSAHALNTELPNLTQADWRVGDVSAPLTFSVMDTTAPVQPLRRTLPPSSTRQEPHFLLRRPLLTALGSALLVAGLVALTMFATSGGELASRSFESEMPSLDNEDISLSLIQPEEAASELAAESTGNIDPPVTKKIDGPSTKRGQYRGRRGTVVVWLEQPANYPVQLFCEGEIVGRIASGRTKTTIKVPLGDRKIIAKVGSSPALTHTRRLTVRAEDNSMLRIPN